MQHRDDHKPLTKGTVLPCTLRPAGACCDSRSSRCCTSSSVSARLVDLLQRGLQRVVPGPSAGQRARAALPVTARQPLPALLQGPHGARHVAVHLAYKRPLHVGLAGASDVAAPLPLPSCIHLRMMLEPDACRFSLPSFLPTAGAHLHLALCRMVVFLGSSAFL